MALDTGEELIAAALGTASKLADRAISIEPFFVPYDQLANADGWAVWLGHPPVPSGTPLLPIRDELLWDEPLSALAAAIAVAADYATRRGAATADEMRFLLQRESPVALIVPGALSRELDQSVSEIESIGVPVVADSSDLASLPQFQLRHTAHKGLTTRRHDPALSFQHFVVDGAIGQDARSAFILHDRPDGDGVTIDGQFDRRIGIEIGISGPAALAQRLQDIERKATRIPAFLNGVSSRFAHGALEIGWRPDAQPTAEEIGQVFFIWLKALFNLEQVSVHIVFAPEDDDSDALASLNARADQLRRERF